MMDLGLVIFLLQMCLSKSLFLLVNHWSEQYLQIILGPFKSELNPIGVMSPKFVSRKIYDLANSKNYLIIISPNPLSYLLFPLKEFFNFLYCKIIYKYKS